MKRTHLQGVGRAVIVVALAAGAGAAHAGELPPASPPTGVVVRDVRVEGAARVEEATIRTALKTAPGEPLDRAIVAEDLRRLARLGFFEDITIDFAGDPVDGIVVVTVKEKPLVRDIEIAGNDALDDDELGKLLDVKRGEILDRPKLGRNAEKLREKYVAEGYCLATVSLAIAPAGAGLADVTFQVAEGPKVRIRSVAFAGNVSLTDAELAAVVGTRPADALSFLSGGGKLSTETLARDVELIRAAYAEIGHLDAKIAPPVLALSRDARELTITFVIDEGRRYRVGDVEVRGPLDGAGLSAPELPGLLLLEKGDWFSRSRLEHDLELLTHRFRDRGFAHVNVSVLPDVETAGEDVCR